MHGFSHWHVLIQPSSPPAWTTAITALPPYLPTLLLTLPCYFFLTIVDIKEPPRKDADLPSKPPLPLLFYLCLALLVDLVGHLWVSDQPPWKPLPPLLNLALSFGQMCADLLQDPSEIPLWDGAISDFNSMINIFTRFFPTRLWDVGIQMSFPLPSA